MENEAELAARITKALERAQQSGGLIDEPHHLAWAIDQMIRELTGCPTVQAQGTDAEGQPYTYDALGESDEYRAFVREACAGDDGPNTYVWDVGIAP